jgi:hypothetical protein
MNHADAIVSIDLFIVPTVACQVLYVFLMDANVSRRIVLVDRHRTCRIDPLPSAGCREF